MRIAMIAAHGHVDAFPNVNLPDTGGQTVYVLELAKALARLGHWVDIYTRHFDDKPQLQVVADKVKIIRLATNETMEFIQRHRTVYEMDNMAHAMRKWIDDNNWSYDVIHSHYYDAGVCAEIFRNLSAINNFRFPHVHTPHSLGVCSRETYGDSEDNDDRILHEKLIQRNCTALIAASQLQCDQFRNPPYGTTAACKADIVHPGYDDSLFFPVPSEWRKRIRNDRGWDFPVVLAAGRFDRCKGYDLLVKAMEVVWVRHPTAKLMLVTGRCDGRREVQGFRDAMVRDVSAMTNPGEIVFSQGVPPADLADLYRACDVFALSSRYEAFGMTAIEAMACGAPTVVTTKSGIAKHMTWGDACLFADPYDSQEFGIAVSNLLTYNEAKGRMCFAAERHVSTLFPWSKVADQMVRIYEEVI